MYDNYSEAIEAFEDMLDEMTRPVFGIMASRIMREMDPIMFRTEFFDWLDGEGIDSDELDTEGYDDLP